MASFTWPAGIDITDGRIAPGEPVTSDLMTDYRDRDDYIQGLFDNVTGHSHTAAAGAGPKITGSLGIVGLSITAAQLAAACVTRSKYSLTGAPAQGSVTAGPGVTAALNVNFNAVSSYGSYPLGRLSNDGLLGVTGANCIISIYQHGWVSAGNVPLPLNGAYEVRAAVSAQNTAGGGTVTMAVQVDYLTATRHAPVLFFTRRKKDGWIEGMAFLPEPDQETPPIHNNNPDYVLYAIEMDRSPNLILHLWGLLHQDRKNRDIMGAMALGLFWGIIRPKYDVVLEPQMSTIEEGPCMYSDEITLIDFDFDWQLALKKPDEWKAEPEHDLWKNGWEPLLNKLSAS